MISRLEVSPGSGTVIRFGPVAAWVASSATPALVSFLSQSAQNLARSPAAGQQLVDHLVGVLSVRDPEPHVAFAVVGPGRRDWAVLLHGPVQAWDGWQWLSCPEDPGWTRSELTPRPSVTVNAAGSPSPAPSPDSLLDLVAGVVPGGGFLLVPDRGGTRPGTPTEATANRATTAGQTEATPGSLTSTSTVAIAGGGPTQVLPRAVEHDPNEPPHDRFGSGGAAMSPTGAGERVDLRNPTAVIARPPLPRGDSPDRPTGANAVVGGIFCPNGHLNRPGMRHCGRCRVALETVGARAVSGTRPPIGCLVLDDGNVYRVDRAYLAGTDPSGDPTVRGGLALPLVLFGDGVSAAHAEFRVDDWDLVLTDRASAAGTFVHAPDAATWTRLTAYQPRVVPPGTHIALGQRVMTFLSPYTAD